jgi:hypothetical protein
MKHHKEYFIIHSNLDKNCVFINNEILIIIIIFSLFLVMVNK